MRIDVAWHPWRELGTLWPHVHVDHVDLTDAGRLGETDGSRLIRLERRQLQVERRCTLAHEMIHLERGHDGPCSPATEAGVDREVARRLIPLAALQDALAWSDNLHEVADELWVTPGIVEARIASLRPAEVATIAQLIADTRGA